MGALKAGGPQEKRRGQYSARVLVTGAAKPAGDVPPSASVGIMEEKGGGGLV